jgi:hypothetical protein
LKAVVVVAAAVVVELFSIEKNGQYSFHAPCVWSNKNTNSTTPTKIQRAT